MRYFLTTIGLFLGTAKMTVALAQFPTYPIRVHTNGYVGQIALAGGPNFFLLKRDTTLTMKADKDGRYFINTGATIGDCSRSCTSYIYMKFQQDGTIDSASLCPKGSVKLGTDHRSIYLQTSLITIQPGQFNRGWNPSYLLNRNDYLFGTKSVRLIKGQTYNINQNDAVLDFNCHIDSATKVLKRDSYTTSSFYFTVSSQGLLLLSNRDRISAVGYGKTLVFKTRSIALNPAEISMGRPLTLGNTRPNVPPITKRTCRPFIRGVVGTVFYVDVKGCQQAYHFIPL